MDSISLATGAKPDKPLQPTDPGHSDGQSWDYLTLDDLAGRGHTPASVPWATEYTALDGSSVWLAEEVGL